MEKLVHLDHYLFNKINHEWASPLLDQVLPILTEGHKNPYVLFGILPLFLFYWIWHQRVYAVKYLLATVLAISLADTIAYQVIKKRAVQRDRPEATGLVVELRTHSHSGYSFPSNHATNTFAAATLISYALPHLRLVLFLLAATIAYSRVYVGVHFPIDVLGGALLGYLVARIVHHFLYSFLEKQIFEGRLRRKHKDLVQRDELQK